MVFIPRVIQESGNDKEAAQIFCLEQATIAGGKARVKTENLSNSRRSQNRSLNHERYILRVIQESGNDEKAAQIFKRPLPTAMARVKTENLSHSKCGQNRFLNHEQ